MKDSMYITNPNGENIEPHGCRDTFIGYTIGLVIAFVLCVCCSCKTVQVSEKVNVRDSMVVRYKDSTVLNIRDSVRLIEHHVTLQDSSHLVIQFGQGGGTYNAKTGEATNVANVHQTDTHNEQRDSTAHYRNLAAEYQHTSDSLTSQLTTLQTEYAKVSKQTRTGYNRFCSWWFWITAILLLIKLAAWVMEKFPATAPYILIARRFVPFL